MSHNTNFNPQLERCAVRDGLHPGPPRETTLTPVERPFTVSQVRNQCLKSTEPLEETVEEVVEETSIEPLEPQTGHLDTLGTQAQNLRAEMMNLELQAALLTIAWQSGNRPPKKLWVIKEPNPFSGGGPDKLCAFVF